MDISSLANVFRIFSLNSWVSNMKNWRQSRTIYLVWFVSDSFLNFYWSERLWHGTTIMSFNIFHYILCTDWSLYPQKMYRDACIIRYWFSFPLTIYCQIVSKNAFLPKRLPSFLSLFGTILKWECSLYINIIRMYIPLISW